MSYERVSVSPWVVHAFFSFVINARKSFICPILSLPFNSSGRIIGRWALFWIHSRLGLTRSYREKKPIENDLVKKFLTFLIREREFDGSEKQHKRWDGREGGYSYQVDILEFPIFYS